MTLSWPISLTKWTPFIDKTWILLSLNGWLKVIWLIYLHNYKQSMCCFMYLDQKSLAAMLTSIQSAGVAPEVNLQDLLHTGVEARKLGNPLWLWIPGQTSPEVLNRGISGPTKRTSVLQKFIKKSDVIQSILWTINHTCLILIGQCMVMW